MQLYTCEACGKRHDNQFSRTCRACDRERESGILELTDEQEVKGERRMNWHDPRQRAELIERVGSAEYDRRFKRWFAASIFETVNGFNIRPVPSHFGLLFAVEGTNLAFRTLEEARAFANKSSKEETT